MLCRGLRIFREVPLGHCLAYPCAAVVVLTETALQLLPLLSRLALAGRGTSNVMIWVTATIRCGPRMAFQDWKSNRVPENYVGVLAFVLIKAVALEIDVQAGAVCVLI